MLLDLAKNLGHRIAGSVDLIEQEHSTQVVGAVLDTARELLGASKAEVYRVGASVVQNDDNNMLLRFACSPRKENSQDPVYQRNPYYSVTDKGVWTYVYRKNCSIWVKNPNQDRSKVPDTETDTDAAGLPAYCSPLDNEIPHSKILPAMYNFADRGVITVITIPFSKKIEEGEACWGILNVEFDCEVDYEKEQFKALKLLTDHISSIVWKTKAWERTKKDTESVVRDFVDWCKHHENSSKNLRSSTLFYKTGLMIKHRESEQKLHDDLLTWFGAKRVQMDEYIIERKTSTLDTARNLEIREIIEKEHFGIVDLSGYEQVLDLPFILGLFAMKCRPCLVLYRTDSREEFPPIVELIAQQAIKGLSGEKLFHVYKYEVVDNEVEFFRDGEIVDKETELRAFFQSVRRQSSPFCHAHDYGRDRL